MQAALKDVTNSYNNTVNRHGFKPASVNSPEFDPFLREKLYGKDTKLERFETFYNEQLRLGKKANTPRKSAKIPFKEGPNDFRKGDMVLIDYNTDKFGRAGYKERRGPVKEISQVNVLASPYIYKLMNPKTKKELQGFYCGKELMRPNLSDEVSDDEN